ncbi:CCAAT-binding protein subunit HAP3, partial [Metarhizium majus ARSEF 297]
MKNNQDPHSSGGAAGHELKVKEQDIRLPIANVTRIMRNALRDNAMITQEAKECMQECVSEFISFITSEASEKCQQEKRKTVNGEDILFAMTSLGFENYAEALKVYLARYHEQKVQSNRENTCVRSIMPAEGGVGDSQNLEDEGPNDLGPFIAYDQCDGSNGISGG